MQLALDRNRLFVLLGALEEDLRELTRRHLLLDHHESEILGPAFSKASERFYADVDRTSIEADLLDYLDLGDEIEILNRWRAELPASLADAIKENAARIGGLVPIRNRVVHRRPLMPDDLASAESTLLGLEASGFDGPALVEALRHLRADVSWSPPSTTEHIAVVLNNLPLPDYDETGLIGRRRELDKLKKQIRGLRDGRSPLITVVGPGGVGKTALTLQAFHDLVLEPDFPFDLVSWVSLKTERLTARGIEVIRDAILSLDQALPVLLEALDEGFSGSIDQVAQALEGLNVLLVIDNLETVAASEVIDLIDALPDSVCYVVTSRVGLGELERRFPLGPLEERYAIDLFRRLARARHVGHLARLSDDLARETVQQLGYSPLALRWFVVAVEAGADPKTVLRHRDDLVSFCVANVFEDLDDNARAVAEVLYLLFRPASVQDLHLYLPGLEPDALRVALQALDRRMLVHRDVIEGTITETFEASEALADFIRVGGVADPRRAREVRKADDEFRRADERHRLDTASDPLRPNVINGGDEHRASILRLREALARSRQGDTDEALTILRDAETLDPEFWEIHRVRGFILSQNGRVDEATNAYEHAIELAPTTDDEAVVKYFFAGHLTRRAHDATRAVEMARAAHRRLNADRTALELGKALAFLGEYEEALVLLRRVARTSELKLRLIGTTLLVDALKRRAEYEASALRRPDVALDTLIEAMQTATDALYGGLVDRKLRDTVVSCAAELMHVAGLSRDQADAHRPIRYALEALSSIGREAQNGRTYDHLVGQTRRLLRRWPSLAADLPAVAAIAGEETLDDGNERTDGSNLRADLGWIKAWKADRHFGFIGSVDGNDDFYFNRGSLTDPGDEILLRRGANVQFCRAAGKDGRPQAAEVALVGDETAEELLDRRLVVARKLEGYLFAEDEVSGAAVFIGRHALRNSSDWDSIDVGFELVGDVEVTEERRFAASTRSVAFPDGEVE